MMKANLVRVNTVSLPTCITVVVVFTLLLAGGHSAGRQKDCQDFWEYTYPYIEEIHTGPLIELKDSTRLEFSGSYDTSKYVGYYYRVLISNAKEWGSIIVDKISVIRTHDEYDERVIDTSYFIDYPSLLKSEGTEIRFIEWSSSTKIKVELFRHDCYEFSLSPDPDSVTANICK
ncbi:MAG: hypothetical protein AB1483_09210 [Candidatus Zixiibacteriota bacterium]